MSLRRTLGTSDLTLLVIGNVIGSGIFLVPSEVLRQTGGSVGAATLVWLVGGVLSLLGALSYGELGSMDRESGGLYAYIRDAFGPLPAFLYGWTLFFVIGAGTIATLAVAAANYAGQLVPSGQLPDLVRKVISVVLIVIMASINVRGLRGSASVQNVATAVKVGAILVMSLVLLMWGNAPESTAAATSTSAVSLSGIGLAMISVLWAYEGWQYVTFTDGEAVNPQRTLPRAIAFGTIILVALYLTANAGYLAALGPERVAASERVASEATAAVLGGWAGKAIALAIILSMYSAAHATVITVPRVYYAMARDGVFFPKLAEVHPVYGTPALAIIASCAWAILLALTGTFQQLLTYVVFVGWMFYALGAAALIALRIRRPDANRPFKVPGYPVTPVLFILAAAAIVVNTIVTSPKQAAVGIGMVLLGIPAYSFFRGMAGRS